MLQAAATIVWVLGGIAFVLALVRPAAEGSPPYWRRPWVIAAASVGLVVVVAADLAN